MIRVSFDSITCTASGILLGLMLEHGCPGQWAWLAGLAAAVAIGMPAYGHYLEEKWRAKK